MSPVYMVHVYKVGGYLRYIGGINSHLHVLSLATALLFARASLLARSIHLPARDTVASGVHQAIPDGVRLHLLSRQVRQLLGGLDIGHVLGVALGEDDVNLLKRSVGSLCEFVSE